MARTTQHSSAIITLLCLMLLIAGCSGPSITSARDTDRLQAVSLSTDQALLAKVACGDSSPVVREAAVRGLRDQAILAKLAATDVDGNVRLAAVKRISDQAVLEHLALESSDQDVAVQAIYRMTNTALLEKMGWEGTNKVLSKAALSRLAVLGVAPEARARAEAKAWAVAAGAGTPQAWKEYLAKFPEGEHAPEANRAIKEAQAFDQAMHGESVRLILDFLRAFPQSKRCSQVREAILPTAVAESEKQGSDEPLLAAIAYLQGQERDAAIAKVKQHTVTVVESDVLVPWGDLGRFFVGSANSEGTTYPCGIDLAQVTPRPKIDIGNGVPYLVVGSRCYYRARTARIWFVDCTAFSGSSLRLCGDARLLEDGLELTWNSVLIRPGSPTTAGSVSPATMPAQ